MRAAVLAFVLFCAGCVGPAGSDAFVIEAPEWTAGDAWSYRTVHADPGGGLDGMVQVREVRYLGEVPIEQIDGTVRMAGLASVAAYVDGARAATATPWQVHPSLGGDEVAALYSHDGGYHAVGEGFHAPCGRTLHMKWGESDPVFLPFPLTSGTTEHVIDEGTTLSIRQRTVVVGPESVTTPAGTFDDAVRIEMVWWYANGMMMPQGLGPDDLEPAVVHYSASAKAVVRMESPFLALAKVPGGRMVQAANHILGEGESSVVELIDMPRREQGSLGDAFFVHDPTASCTEAVARPDEQVSLQVRIQPTIERVGPVVFEASQHGRGYDSRDVTWSWRLEGSQGVVDEGLGSSWSTSLPVVDRYTVTVTASVDGHTKMDARALTPSLYVEKDVACRPHVSKCAYDGLALGYGADVAHVVIEPDRWEDVAAGGALVLVDAQGVEVARREVDAATNDQWEIAVEPDWSHHAPGAWQVIWEPVTSGATATLSASAHARPSVSEA